MSAPPGALGGGHAFVIYRDRMLLKIPVAATSLVPPQPSVPPTKVTREALEELIALTRDSSGGTACPSEPSTSGGACPTTSGARSSTTSPRSSPR